MAIVLLVTGDRYWTDYQFILHIIRSWHEAVGIGLLRHGDCRGADRLAGKAADTLRIPVDPCPADWERHGNAAGPIRNGLMLVKDPMPELVLAFHDHLEASRGTRDMLRKAMGRGLAVVIENHQE